MVDIRLTLIVLELELALGTHLLGLRVGAAFDQSTHVGRLTVSDRCD